MSTFRVDLTEVLEVSSHPNADRLDIVKVFDWKVIAQKGSYTVGDKVIYTPVDSVLTEELEAKLFSPDSKIKLHNRRIRSIKIRGLVSQGMLINAEDLDYDWVVTNITKYEPPISSLPNHMQLKKKNKPDIRAFKKYTDIENWKYYGRSFKEGEQVYISEKLHGTSARYGWFKTEANAWWQKILNFFGFLPEWTFAYGSRNVQIQTKWFKKHSGFQSEEQGVDFGDVYSKMIVQYSLKDKIPKGWAIYGEIVGEGIQKYYTYGLKGNQHEFYVYDIMVDGKYLDYEDTSGLTGALTFKDALSQLGLLPVPLVYKGEYEEHLVDLYKDGDSLIRGQKIREGIVIKSIKETSTGSLGRKVLKAISESYYMLKDGTDFH